MITRIMLLLSSLKMKFFHIILEGKAKESRALKHKAVGAGAAVTF